MSPSAGPSMLLLASLSRIPNNKSTNACEVFVLEKSEAFVCIMIVAAGVQLLQIICFFMQIGHPIVVSTGH